MSGDKTNTGRRRFLTAATTVVGAVGAGFVLVPFISSMQPSAKARAAGAPVRADISKLEPGQMIRVKWRGKPIFIRRRKPEEIGMITAHANGSKPSDASEALAIGEVFGASSVPVTGFKWSIGHTVAASGVIEGILTLEEKITGFRRSRCSRERTAGSAW